MTEEYKNAPASMPAENNPEDNSVTLIQDPTIPSKAHVSNPAKTVDSEGMCVTE